MADDRAVERQRMIDEQIEGRGVHDRLVTGAMRCVPRERFVLPGDASEAYTDQALPIAAGQTISQPYMIALMIAELSLTGGERVLEIGTGSGYESAVLAEIAAEVYTVERIPELADAARERLRALGYTNVFVHAAGDVLGWPEAAPYDAIIVAAGARSFPDELVGQLLEGGRLVVPVGDRRSQTLYRYVRRDGAVVPQRVCACSFVPLVGPHGWQPDA